MHRIEHDKLVLGRRLHIIAGLQLAVFHFTKKDDFLYSCRQLLGVQGGDSLGISVSGETPQKRSDEEAHRRPQERVRLERKVTGSENSRLVIDSTRKGLSQKISFHCLFGQPVFVCEIG